MPRRVHTTLVVSALTAGVAPTLAAQAPAPPQGPGRSDPSFPLPSIAPGVDYTVPTEAEITQALGRIRDYFVRSTPYRVIDTATGQPLDQPHDANADRRHRSRAGRVQRLDLLDGRGAGRHAARDRRHRRPVVRGVHAEELRLHRRSRRVLPAAGEGVRPAALRLPPAAGDARTGRLRRDWRGAGQDLQADEGRRGSGRSSTWSTSSSRTR